MRIAGMHLPGFRIYLRPLSPYDIDHVMTWVNDPEVTQKFALMREMTREKELLWIEKNCSNPDEATYSIFTRSDNQYVGQIGLHQIYWPARKARIGITLAQRGLGYGPEAIKLLTAIAFWELDLHKVFLVHFRTNTAMAHITNELGFAYEGCLRDEYVDYEGQYQDLIRVSILREEFEERLAKKWGVRQAVNHLTRKRGGEDE